MVSSRRPPLARKAPNHPEVEPFPINSQHDTHMDADVIPRATKPIRFLSRLIHVQMTNITAEWLALNAQVRFLALSISNGSIILMKSGAFKTLTNSERCMRQWALPPKNRSCATDRADTALPNLFGTAALGYPKVSNYIGSWKEWGDRLDLPGRAS